MTDPLAPIAGLIADFQALSAIGRDPEGGWSRPAFGPQDCAAQEWFLARAREMGMSARYDAFGNAIARTPGMGPAVALGSHLDTVKNGGAYDGALGVLAGLEIARRAIAAGTWARPIEVIAFRDEEGRFGPFTGSRAMTGGFTPDDLAQKRGQDGTPLVEAMAEAGFDPSRVREAARDFSDLHGYVELHIEQGPVLEARGDAVGIVTAIAGQERFAIRFTGRPDHAGAAPMELRNDAFAATAHFADRFRAMILADPSDTLRGTIGVVKLMPNQANVVPGEVRLALEIRDTDGTALSRATAMTEALVAETGAAFGSETKVRRIYGEAPVALSSGMQESLAAAARAHGIRHSRLPSGANHDAGIVAAHLPVAMLFVPSKDGRSHCPEEHTDWAPIAQAVTVLEEAVRQIAEQEF
ncbi:Zn-dependent hydrolase [Pseudodonghicola flavimaris]|uniref:Zn-dependent hydrolase n=1 Tax=Pseudodonghicola flavimaris TaxID=3050036 RepID=A0ABT7EYG7_9RHOB|nr:Zn-dependent hydrolase [Pseudodonghicola flavimaris]MDK3017315.1 Zn-dependent hydrolase [Pseudodonghicola flavimaris]